MFVHPLAQSIFVSRRFVVVTQFFSNQRFQRIRHRQGIQIQHQTVLDIGLSRLHRLQVEHLRLDRLTQVQHQSHGGRGELTHSHTGDVGVVAEYFANEFAQGRVQFNALNIHRQSGWLCNKGVFGDQCSVRFNRHAGVVAGGPDPHRHNGGATGELSASQQQHQRTGL